MNRRFIGVIGSGTCDDDTRKKAREVGQGLAERGYGIVCGGLGGVMESACRGANDAGGLTVGILPGENPDSANPYVDVAIATGMGVARNAIIVHTAAAVVAVSGGPGTLSEIAHCLQLGVPVVSLGSFDISDAITQVSTPAQAVTAVVSLLE